MLSPVAMPSNSAPSIGRANSAPNTSIARFGSASARRSRARLFSWPDARRSSRACRPRNGSPCDGITSTSSGTAARSFSIDAIQSASGSASGSVGNTDTLDEMRGSTWSPEISSFSSS